MIADDHGDDNNKQMTDATLLPKTMLKSIEVVTRYKPYFFYLDNACFDRYRPIIFFNNTIGIVYALPAFGGNILAPNLYQ